MNKKKKLLDERASKHARMTEITGGLLEAGKAPTEDQSKELASLRARIKEIDGLLELADEVAGDRERLDAEIDPPLDSPRPSSAASEPATAGTPAASLPGSPKAQVVSSGREHLPFTSIAEYLGAVKAAKMGSRHPGLDVIHNAALHQAAASGFNITVPSDGGFLLQMDHAQELKRTAFEGSKIAQFAERLPLSQGSRMIKLPYVVDKNRSTGSIAGGLKWYSTSEAEAAKTSKTKVEYMSLELKKLTAAFQTTSELERNAAVLVALVRLLFRDQLSYQLDKWALFGNGVDEATGMLKKALNPALIVVLKEASQANGTILYKNIDNVETKFTGGDKSLVFTSRSGKSQLSQMSMPVGTGGVPVWLPASGIIGQRQSSLYGMPLVTSGLAKAVGQEGDLAFLDPVEYYWIDESDVKFDASMHVRFLEGEMTYRFEYEADGRPSWYDKLTEENGDTVSPYVIIEKRAA